MSLRARKPLILAFVLGAVVLGSFMVYVFGGGELLARHETFMLYFDDTVNGLGKGSLVRFKGVPVGEVLAVRLSFNRAASDRRIPVVIQLNTDLLHRQLGVLEDLTDPAVLAEEVRRGLRAQLQTESYVTGGMFVELNIHPRAAVPKVMPASEWPIIPTIASQAVAGRKKIEKIVAWLPNFDFRAEIANAGNILDSVTSKVMLVPFAEYHQKVVDYLAPLTRLNPGTLPRRIDNFLGRLTQVHDQVARANRQFAASSQTFVAYNQQDRQMLKNADANLSAVREELQPAAPWLAHLTHNLQQFTADLERFTGKVDTVEEAPGVLNRPAK